jgi:hypothetical protein
MIKRLDFSNIEYLLLRRAKEHLADLEAEINDIVETNHDIRTDDGNPWEGQGPDTMYGELILTDPAPQPIRGKVGEFAIGLRAALDFMTVMLARFDSGSNEFDHISQFPIDDFPDKFPGHRKSYLKGISDEHIAFFERYQPYKGCNWMKRLRDLSNTGKHIDLVLVRTDYSRLFGTTWENGGEYDEAEGSVNGYEVHVEEITAEITFPDGTPVVDALKVIHAQVTQIFQEFKTLFVS